MEQSVKKAIHLNKANLQGQQRQQQLSPSDYSEASFVEDPAEVNVKAKQKVQNSTRQSLTVVVEDIVDQSKKV